MNLYFRLTWILLLAVLRRRVSVSEAMMKPPRLRLVSLPNDIDLNFHVNNGRLATLLVDFGMLYLFGRGRVLGQLISGGTAPVVGGTVIRYRHPVGLFARFEVETRLLCWDQKWFYCKHLLILGRDKVAVSAITRTCLVRKGGSVIPADFLARLDHDAPSPDPAAVAQLFDSANRAFDSHVPLLLESVA